MSAPLSITPKNISGTYVMNKSLSSDHDAVLQAQGVGWFTRKAIGMASVSLKVKHYTSEEDSVERIDVIFGSIAGIKPKPEAYVFNATTQERDDPVFGQLVTNCKRVALSEIHDEFLNQGWLDDIEEGGGVLLIFSEADLEKQTCEWVARQTWGFAEIEVNGEKQRRYVRRVKFSSPSLSKNLTLVYDYISE